MPVDVSILLFGDEVFAEKIEQMGRRATNMSPAINEVKDMWVDWIEEQFETEGKRSGNPWAPLKRSTVLRRGSAHPILVRSADLLLEATDESNYHATDEDLFFMGTDEVEEYGGFHQSGFTHSSGTEVPARPLVDFTPADRERTYEVLQDFIVFGRLPG